MKGFYKDHPLVSWIVIDVALIWIFGNLTIYTVEQIIYGSMPK